MCSNCQSPLEKKFHEAWMKNQSAKSYTLEPQKVLGNHRVDFAIKELQTAIEIDSKQYHSKPDEIKRDKEREQVLRKEGWHFIRVYGPDVFWHTPESVKLILFGAEQYYAGRIYSQKEKFEKIFCPPTKMFPSEDSEKKEKVQNAEEEGWNEKFNTGCAIISVVLSLVLPIIMSIIELLLVDSGDLSITKGVIQGITLGTIALIVGPLFLCFIGICGSKGEK